MGAGDAPVLARGPLQGGALLRRVAGEVVVRVAAPATGEPWCLDVDVVQRGGGATERLLWDATTPGKEVPRGARPPAAALASAGAEACGLRVTAEQGIGDLIQQWRYLPAIAGRFRRVQVECRPELRRLFERQGLAVELVAPGDDGALDGWTRASLMRLDAAVADPTDGRPYLTIRPPARPAGRQGRRRPRIGLNWHTNTRAAACSVRSIPVELLGPLVAGRPDLDWVSLQWGGEERRLDGQAWSGAVERLGTQLSDIADLAEAIADLDLLISIDSAPSHLAGALGVPVWALLSSPCSWRWGLATEATPLYRSMRLIRQPASGDWPGLLAATGRLLDAALPPDGAGTDLLPAAEPERGLEAAARGAGPRAGDLAEALALCRREPRLRDAFVREPLRLLAALGTAPGAHDYPALAAVFAAMADCHGGFSWCTPLPAAGVIPP